MGSVNINGVVVPDSTPVINADNRAFRYGDGLFESMRIVNSRVMLLEQHLQRLEQGMTLLRLDMDAQKDAGFWRDQILALCEENCCLELGRIRLSIYRNNGGNYAPVDSGFGYLIEARINESEFCNPGASGLRAGLFDELRKPVNALGSFKTANSLIYVLAGIACNRAKMDEMLILNDRGSVAEAISSNLFIVSGDAVKTPSLGEGCVAGVMRDQVIRQLKVNGLGVEEGTVSLDEVMGADEAFVTNAIQGVRKLASVGTTRFGDRLVREICSITSGVAQ